MTYTANITPGRYSAQGATLVTTKSTATPIPVTLDGGSVTIENITVPTSVTVNNTNAAPVPVSDAGGTLSIDDGGGSITVDGPLTDTQIRATALPVSGPLTDTQLRATALPVSGPVTGGLTDTQLRATAVPVTSNTAARTPTTTSINSAATSTLILASNASRKGLTLSNVSTNKLYLSFSNPATVANSFIEMQPGSFILFDQQLIVTNAIYGIWTNANGTAQVTEFV